MTADPVLAPADLDRWSFAGTALAVLGRPIAHSLSPPMHNAALASLAREDGRFADWRYFRFDVAPDDLPRTLELLHARRFRGINLTVPHKVLAFERVAEVDPEARPARAVNTLLWTPGGWRGANTDGYGLSAALRAALGRELAGASVVLLGAGGAARGAAVECLRRGCRRLWMSNRTPGRLAGLLGELRPLAGGIPVTAPPDPPPEGAIVINATTLGLGPDDGAPVDLAKLPRPAAVYDMIYRPPRTALLRQAGALGLPAANGLSMLVHQGAKSLEIWTGVPAARTAPIMERAAREAARAG